MKSKAEQQNVLSGVFGKYFNVVLLADPSLSRQNIINRLKPYYENCIIFPNGNTKDSEDAQLKMCIPYIETESGQNEFSEKIAIARFGQIRITDLDDEQKLQLEKDVKKAIENLCIGYPLSSANAFANKSEEQSEQGLQLQNCLLAIEKLEQDRQLAKEQLQLANEHAAFLSQSIVEKEEDAAKSLTTLTKEYAMLVIENRRLSDTITAKSEPSPFISNYELVNYLFMLATIINIHRAIPDLVLGAMLIAVFAAFTYVVISFCAKTNKTTNKATKQFMFAGLAVLLAFEFLVHSIAFYQNTAFDFADNAGFLYNIGREQFALILAAVFVIFNAISYLAQILKQKEQVQCNSLT